MAPSAVVHPRDAGGTRRRLLEAARCRFARDGFSGTTVRDIATDAGVNVALINRYFESKEGLFEACLRQVVADLNQPPAVGQTLDEIVERIVGQLADVPGGEPSLQLLLLLRSPKDPRADQIRRATLVSFAEGIAAVAGPGSGTAADSSDALLLRAQIVLSAVMGMALLRSTGALEPLTTASVDDLREPVHDLVSALIDRLD